MTLKEVLRQIKSLEKSLKGEKDIQVVLDKWGKIAFLTGLKQKLEKEEQPSEQYC